MNQDYDGYKLNPFDKTRIDPMLNQIETKELSFKFFISSTYCSNTSYGLIEKHNKEIRRTIRTFYKAPIRMWFFIEKHLDPSTPNYGGFGRHILIEDAPALTWSNPSSRMRNFLMDSPETYFDCTLGSGITDQQKMELLTKVIRQLPFIPNGRKAIDIRPIHNLEKLVAYCSKQFEWVLPSYQVIDPTSSDIDITPFVELKQNGLQWQPRYETVS